MRNLIGTTENTVKSKFSGGLAKVNPIRYRGYYFDEETGLYYCIARYYDPEVGRFVNADVYLSTGQGAIGFNLYSYCLNNAVNRVDISGSMSAVADVLNNSPGLLGLAVLDGPLPIGDIIAAIGCIILLAITVDEIEEKIVAAPKVGETAVATGERKIHLHLK